MSRHPRPIGYITKIGAQVTIGPKARLTLGKKLQSKPLPSGAWDEIEEITSAISVLSGGAFNASATSLEKKLRTLGKHAKSVKIAITGPFSEQALPPSSLPAIYTKFFEVPNIGELSDVNMLLFLIAVLDGVQAVCAYVTDQLRQARWFHIGISNTPRRSRQTYSRRTQRQRRPIHMRNDKQ